MRKPVVVLAVLLMTSAFLFSAVRPAQAQTYGIELHNAMMPASAGMGGASLWRSLRTCSPRSTATRRR